MTSENEVLEVLSFLVLGEVPDPDLTSNGPNRVARTGTLKACDCSVLELYPIPLLFGGNLRRLPPIKRLYHAASLCFIVFCAHDNPGTHTVEAMDRSAKIALHAWLASGLARIPKCHGIVP